jgi:3-oxoadipate enol-lactonase
MPTLKLPDSSIHYDLFGTDGEPILLIQGVGVIGKAWTPQIAALSSRFRVVSFDNRGIGQSPMGNTSLSIESMARDAIALLDHLGWKSAHVAGHSMGGLIAQELALRFPNRLRSLALLCTFSRGPEAARLTPWVLWMTLRTRIGSARMRRTAFLEMLFSKNFLAAADCDHLAAEVGELVGRDLATSPAILMKQLIAMRNYNAFARLGSITLPTLILSGELDPIALARFSKSLAQVIPNHHFVELRGASHGCTIENANDVNRHYLEFLGSVCEH